MDWFFIILSIDIIEYTIENWWKAQWQRQNIIEVSQLVACCLHQFTFSHCINNNLALFTTWSMVRHIQMIDFLSARRMEPLWSLIQSLSRLWDWEFKSCYNDNSAHLKKNGFDGQFILPPFFYSKIISNDKNKSLKIYWFLHDWRSTSVY